MIAPIDPFSLICCFEDPKFNTATPNTRQFNELSQLVELMKLF